MTINNLTQHNTNRTVWLGYLAESLATGSGLSADAKLLNTYYDALEAFWKAYDKTGDATYLNYLDRAQAAYATYYVDPNNGNVPGYWSFTHGLKQEYLRRADSAARTSLVSLSTNAAYHRDTPDTTAELEDDLLSRENAYAGMAHINAELCGEARRSRLTTLKDNALSQIDQWCTSLTAGYFRPFMGALTARFLIYYYTYIEADPAIVTALATMGDYMHSTCWVGASSSWTYTDRNVGSTDPVDLDPQPDLNLLIVPYLGWLWWQTGDQKWKDRGDAAFDGGVAVYDQYGFWVSGAYLGGMSGTSVNGKHVCQNFVWSDDYLYWRDLEPVGGPPLVTNGTSVTYNVFTKSQAESINLASDTLEMALLNEYYVPSAEHTTESDILQYELTGNGYSRATLAGVSWARSGTTSRLTCTNPTFTASGGDLVAKYWVVLTAGGSLIAYGLLWETGDIVTIADGEPFTVDCTLGITKTVTS